ncbi:MAG: hypothetical protein AAF497_17075 [Planctomycetota bacterium]
MRKSITPYSLATTLFIACMAGCQQSESPSDSRSVSEPQPEGLTSTAESIIIVQSRLPNGEAANESTQKGYRLTCGSLMKSAYVLTAALRSPELADLRLLENREMPEEWLKGQLDVQCEGDSNLIVVRLSGSPSQEPELVQLLGAVVDAFMVEIAQADRTQLSDRLQMLQKEERSTFQKLRDNNSRLSQLADVVPVDRDNNSSHQYRKLSNRAEVSHERIVSLAKRMDDLWIRYEAAGDDLSRRMLKTEHDATVSLIAKVKADYEKSMTELEKLRSAPRHEWEEARINIELLTAQLRSIRSDVTTLERNLKRDPAIRVVQPAMIVHENDDSVSPTPSVNHELVEA